MKSAKLLFATIAVFLASSAWSQTLPSNTEIKVRTDTAIPAKPSPNSHYSATVSNDITDSSGNVVIPRGSPARLVAEANGDDTNLDLRSVDVNGKRYSLTTEDKSSGPSGLGANKRTAKYVGGGAAVGAVLGALLGWGQGCCHWSSRRRCGGSWCPGLHGTQKGNPCRN